GPDCTTLVGAGPGAWLTGGVGLQGAWLTGGRGQGAGDPVSGCRPERPIEGDLAAPVGSTDRAGNVILELSKEKPNERLLERQAAQFTASVQKVESELSGQIRYLTQVATGQPHEGSSYSARKGCQMALNRVDYARVKLGELARTCEHTLEQ
uniref:Mediator of RNA polymerase II transcription subunit 11 n=1 Tax=Chrysemys picta bellii TaxID=8478 RepID=A0A8C3P5L8_CHRPI